jgi:hypothetical protein
VSQSLPQRLAQRLAPTLSALISICVAAVAAQAAPPELPDEGDCPTVTATPTGGEESLDAVPVALKEGMVLHQEDMMVLQQLLPVEIWHHRDAFFHEGMRMEIAACHRRYPGHDFFREATERHRGQAKLDGKGNLKDHVAGLPFPPDEIDPEDPKAALKWAWNLERRHRGAGHAGKFRISDLPNRMGGIQTYTGRFFLIQTSHRGDLAEAGYRVPNTEGKLWAAGGVFESPFDARHLAWRQFRPEKSWEKYQEPDDTFVYVPTMRKMRRAASSWVDGFFFPRYTVSGDAGGGGIAFGGGLGGGGSGAINPTAGQSIATSEHIRRGFVGLTLRPNAYAWRYRGERAVLAPLNATRPGYPRSPDRNFGPSGLSLASDSWDVRYAVVIEGALRVPEQEVRTITIYVDYQTQQPLYWITRTDRRRLLDIGVLAHRFTGDVPKYPDWPGGTPTLVFEPVAAAFYNALEGGGGWRRESYDLRSIPFDKDERRSMTTSMGLSRGH